jgi:uncharacterized protein (DUF1501 family)
MLTFLGAKQRFCDQYSRRDFLKVGALGIGGLTLADILRLKAQGAAQTSHKAVIMICLSGGPSHIDMYDLKPDAPDKIRGEFKPINTNVPGIDISEMFPLQAQIADKFSIIRSMRFLQGGHTPPELLTGFVDSRRPDIGATVSRLRKDAGIMGALPPYVAMDIESYTSFLGNAHKPFNPRSGVNNSDSLALAKGVTLPLLEERKQLLKSFDSLSRDLDDRRGALASVDAFHAQALEMIATPKARDAFDISKESEETRKKYGKSTKMLQARRLVEAGVPVVTMTFYNPEPVPKACTNPHWDHHDQIYTCLRPLLPHLDRGIHALVTDLFERGLDKDVAVCVWGEMGRTPVIGEQKGTVAGRDHWPQAGFCFISGGGLKMGQVVGSTNKHAEHPKTKPYNTQNVLSTLYHVLGIDAGKTTIPDHTGRPMYLLDDTDPVAELV